MYLLELKKVSEKEQEVYVVQGVSFTQKTAQKIAIAGATGSGKTTLLKMIAGLVQPSSGTIYFEEKKIEGPEEKLIPGHPQIAYLSQHFELRNHYRVFEIIEMAKPATVEWAATICGLCKIEQFANRFTHQLSGGERQRIALALLLVGAPKLLLLDEPYSNLDTINKNILKQVVDDVCESLQTTCLLVSHHAEDVLSWADEIIILEGGKIIQQDVPEKIYRQPVNAYTAALFGKYNVFTPTLAQTFSACVSKYNPQLHRFIRPEQIIITSKLKGIRAVVKKINFLGSFYEAEVIIDEAVIVLHTKQQLMPGEVVFISMNLEGLEG